MKIHLAYSDEPLKVGGDVEAVCGQVINLAVFPFVFDGEFPDAAHLNSTRICGKCYAIDNHKWKYLYGLANGQEVRTVSE